MDCHAKGDLLLKMLRERHGPSIALSFDALPGTVPCRKDSSMQLSGALVLLFSTLTTSISPTPMTLEEFV